MLAHEFVWFIIEGKNSSVSEKGLGKYTFQLLFTSLHKKKIIKKKAEKNLKLI